MPIDYMQMLLDLMEERQKWLGQRDEAIREISRLSELIRATARMIPPEKLARYEPIFERLENRPPGLSIAIRACFTAGKDWLTPVEIRDTLKNMGFPFENYKANPLASIHTTLKRMVPAEIETKMLKDGQKAYRLKSAIEWKAAMAEVRQWMLDEYELHKTAGSVIAVKRRKKEKEEEKKEEPSAGAKHGTVGSA